jgi:hypothetical protein
MLSISCLWETHPLPEERKHIPFSSDRTVSSPGSDTTLPVPSKNKLPHFSLFTSHALELVNKLYTCKVTHSLHTHMFQCVGSLKRAVHYPVSKLYHSQFLLACNNICPLYPFHSSQWPQSVQPTSTINPLPSPDHFSIYLDIIRAS